MFKTIESQSKFSLRENNASHFNSYQSSDGYLAYGELTIKSMSSIYKAIFNVVYDIENSEIDEASIRELKEVEETISNLFSLLKKVKNMNSFEGDFIIPVGLDMSDNPIESTILETKKQLVILESKKRRLLKKMNQKTGVKMTAIRLNIQLFEKKEGGMFELYDLNLKEKVSKYDIFLESEGDSCKEDLNNVFFKIYEKKIYEETVSLIKEMTFDNEVFSF